MGFCKTADPSDATKENEEMSKRLYVGNLSYGTTETDLRELFGKNFDGHTPAKPGIGGLVDITHAAPPKLHS